MDSKLGSLSIVIAAHNKAPITELCLCSLLELTFRPLEVIVVDNGSTDGTPATLEAFGPIAEKVGILFRTVRLARNFGPIVARNRAIHICHGEYIAFLDNDVIIRSRGLFERLIGHLREDQRAGAVTPKFVYPCSPFRIQCAGGGITREGDCYLIGRGEEREKPEFNYVTCCPWTISACMVLSAELIRLIGPMDEVFNPIGCEDVDYCFRVRARNRQIVYRPDVEIYHIENTTSFRTPTLNIQRAMKRSQRIIKRKWCHMFPVEPSTKELPLMHVPAPRVPLWTLRELPTL
ncbi:MAG: glycosyltransferase [Acidobacteriia bacterium]|nr:glycosyltransferase [Terriglobia bacterium]